MGFSFFAALVVSSACAIERGLCWANLDGNFYDLRILDRNQEAFTLTQGNFEYSFRPCSPIKNESSQSFDDFVAVRFDTEKNITTKISTVNDYDYKYIDPSDPEKGVRYFSKTREYRPEYGNEFFHIDYVMECDRSITEFPKSPTSIAGVIDRPSLSFTITFRGAFACPRKVLVPEPTPSFNPDCTFMWRNTSNSNYGLKFDLADLNRGPYGNRYEIDIEGVSYALFYHPCGRMRCPLGYRCEEQDEYASTWLCPPRASDNGRCKNYGINDELIHAHLTQPEDHTMGVTVTQFHESNLNRRTSYVFRCDRNVPEHLMEVETEATLSSNLLVYVDSSDVCERYLPPPGVIPMESLQFKETYLDTSVTMNISALPPIHKLDVEIHSEYDNRRGYLHINMNEAMVCPSDCFGNEDATAYLCDENERCQSYSYVENDVKLSGYGNSAILNGVLLHQKSDAGYGVNIHYICDPSVEFEPSKHVMLRGREMYLDIVTKEACPVGSQTPPAPKPWRPEIPQTYASWVNMESSPVAFNLTHYTKLDLQKADQGVFRDSILAIGPQAGQSMNMDVVYHPHMKQKCPAGHDCHGINESQLWMCWDGKCFPYGWLGTKLDFIDKRVPEIGVKLAYSGINATSCVFYILPSEDKTTMVPLSKQSVAFFTSDGTVKIFVWSSHIKLDRMKYPYVPQPVSTPKPDWTKKVNYYKKHRRSNEDFSAEINLSLIRSHHETALFELPNGAGYERGMIYMYPTYPGGCPSGYDCLDTGNHNIYKCYNYNNNYKCYSLGDIPYGFDISEYSDNVFEGFVVKYGGGHGGLKTEVRYTCDPSLENDQLFLSNVVSLDDKVVKITAHSAIVCPKWLSPVKPDDDDPSVIDHVVRRMSPGSWFFVILVVSLLLYFAYCTVGSFAKDGRITMFPHSNFWREFWLCFVTGVGFIFTCGFRKPKIEDQEYEHMDV